MSPTEIYKYGTKTQILERIDKLIFWSSTTHVKGLHDYWEREIERLQERIKKL